MSMPPLMPKQGLAQILPLMFSQSGNGIAPQGATLGLFPRGTAASAGASPNASLALAPKGMPSNASGTLPAQAYAQNQSEGITPGFVGYDMADPEAGGYGNDAMPLLGTKAYEQAVGPAMKAEDAASQRLAGLQPYQMKPESRFQKVMRFATDIFPNPITAGLYAATYAQPEARRERQYGMERQGLANTAQTLSQELENTIRAESGKQLAGYRGYAAGEQLARGRYYNARVMRDAMTPSPLGSARIVNGDWQQPYYTPAAGIGLYDIGHAQAAPKATPVTAPITPYQQRELDMEQQRNDLSERRIAQEDARLDRAAQPKRGTPQQFSELDESMHTSLAKAENDYRRELAAGTDPGQARQILQQRKQQIQDTYEQRQRDLGGTATHYQYPAVNIQQAPGLIARIDSALGIGANHARADNDPLGIMK